MLDPVMIATSGDRLLAPDAVEALRKLLIPRALVVTPNLPEAAALVGASPARNEQEMEIQARELLALGAQHVLIKGGHGSGEESVDLADRAGCRAATVGETRGHEKHAWNGLYAVFSDRGGPCQGARSQSRSAESQGVCHWRHCCRRQAQDRTWPRARAPFS